MGMNKSYVMDIVDECHFLGIIKVGRISKQVSQHGADTLVLLVQSTDRC
ncbi:uncharacterized protein PITG_20931 [Phytophthora infestans T30-4]|uniref:Uncharacterized protein n=1 Tax=Phytophthora infestans (strain T30-4) TaxID=403677 RepID=D0P2X7_PHYIT|nr:uncharacterized protein PITG_20931 [Phytophthora infestans T30-4]EEY58499.1 conserved hypothetical protein [Phytophthora infestans T30-4]|eukprot:XP_002895350.1 conserved hypothetical protein [Phytophthora infestans T30-4]